MKRSMRDLGLLLLRVPAGLLLAGHGAQKVFGWFDGPGPEKQGETFESLGYPEGKKMAYLAGLTEMGSGIGLATGTLTPLAAAGVIGVMTNATVSVHKDAGVWNQQGGYEYPIVLASLSTGLAIHGPGKLSIDAAIGQIHAGLRWGLAAVAFGLGVAGAILSMRQEPTEQ